MSEENKELVFFILFIVILSITMFILGYQYGVG